jgi:hypothetical protein
VTRAHVVEAIATSTATSTAPVITTTPVVTRAPVVTTAPMRNRHDEAKRAASSDKSGTPAASDESDTPATVAKRYIAVGKALRGAPDALWERYRRIRINDALASSDTRRATLATLAEIENALSPRK